MPNITTFEILDEEIKKVGGKPTVLEALWDGDTQGWFLCLYVYTETRYFFFKKTSRHSLGHITLGGDIRVFSGGQWTEAFLAKELGQRAVEKHNLEFYFPSDEQPDDDCPKWTDKHLAVQCADCNKLIIPTDSPYLPKDICYNCHLERERNERIVKEQAYDDGVTMYLSKDDEYDNIGYCSNFKDFTIAPFINDKVQQQLTGKAISVVTLDKSDIMELNEVLETELNRKLEKYVKPVIDDRMSRFVKTHKVNYNGIEYELDDRFNNDHNEISNLIYSLQTNQKAIANNYEYKIYFKNGITHRDDTILRFVNYISKGVSDIKSINEHYKKILTETEVARTIEKLNEIGCLEIKGNIVTITKTGKNIV
jgi:hypothetical protein